MATMSRVYAWTVAHPDQLTVIGQFHDEIVVDWVPGRLGLSQAKQNLQEIMSTAPHWVPSFPLDADIKSAYRYIK